jgi:uncharacterized protein (DUF2141 family)
MMLNRRWVILFSALVVGTPPGGSPLTQAEPQAKGCILRIHADGLRNSKGVVGVLLFTSTVGWPEDISKTIRHEAISIKSGEPQATVVLNDVPPGEYGIVALHDENKNMKLDRNAFGWPKEGFGFANNPRVVFGPPAFKQAIIHVTCPATDTIIHMVYK